MTETFYDVLDVPPDASQAEIESAYRDRIKETHPDLSDDDDAEAETKRVIEAHDVLGNEDERAEYDRVGHAAYVGEAETDVDRDDVSDAAAAARRAGWADQSNDDRNGRTGTDPRSDPYERRRRERAARERVSEERSRRGRRADPSGASGATADRDAAASPDGGTATARGGGGARRRRNVGATPSWNASEGYTVRKEYDEGFHPSRLFPSGSLTLLGIAFLLYPVILFSAVFPEFPLVVNVVVGLCLIFLVGYLQSMPEVGVIVFGFWSVVGTLALFGLGLEVASLLGVLVLSGTWLPFGLSVLTLSLVRP